MAIRPFCLFACICFDVAPARSLLPRPTRHPEQKPHGPLAHAFFAYPWGRPLAHSAATTAPASLTSYSMPAAQANA